MSIKKLKTDVKAPKGKSPRVTMAIEPKIAEIIRDLAKLEKLELSQFLEQATIAWIRRWRPEFELVVEGAEGPQERTNIVEVREGDQAAADPAGERARGAQRPQESAKRRTQRRKGTRKVSRKRKTSKPKQRSA